MCRVTKQMSQNQSRVDQPSSEIAGSAGQFSFLAVQDSSIDDLVTD